MSKIDITLVGGIVKDYTNLTIRLLSKQNYIMWEKQYRSRASFDKNSRIIQIKFFAELKRREAQQSVS